MLKISLLIHGDAFTYDGNDPIDSVVSLIRHWLDALPHGRHHEADALREMTARLAESTTALSAALVEEAGAVSRPTITHIRKRDPDMAVPAILTELDAEVTRSTTVSHSAAVLIRGISARLAAAVAAAMANGATAAELEPITVEVAALKTASDDLTAAISENTPNVDPDGNPV